MIRQVHPDDLWPGMTVATPICDREGRTLCAAGAILTERTVGRLRAMGLGGVAVVVENPAAREEAARQIRHRFRRVLNEPDMVELCELFTRACRQRAEAEAAGREALTDGMARPDGGRRPSPLVRFARACLGGGTQPRKAAR